MRTIRLNRNVYLTSLVFWLLICTLTVLKAGLVRNSAGPVYWGHIFSYTFSSGVLWAVFTIPILWLVQRFPLARYHWIKLIGIHLGLSIVVSAVQRVISLSVDYVFQSSLELVPDFMSYSQYFSHNYLRRLLEGMLWYGIIISVLYGYEAYRSSKKAQTELSLLKTKPASNQLVLKTKEGLVKIDFTDIAYIKAQGNYLKIYCKDQELLFRSSMKEMAKQLVDSSFYRVHHSYFVNADLIEKIEHVYNGEYSFTMKDSLGRVPSSGKYKGIAVEVVNSFKS